MPHMSQGVVPIAGIPLIFLSSIPQRRIADSHASFQV